jgi:hypothetical protein
MSPSKRDVQRFEGTACGAKHTTFERHQSIRQSVQNGQFLSGFIEQSANTLIASHPQKRVERPLVHVITAAMPMNETPILKPIQPAYDCRAGHAHVGRDLGDRERPFLQLTKSDAQTYEERLQAGPERLTCRGVGSMQTPHDLDHQATEHDPLPRGFDPV